MYRTTQLRMYTIQTGKLQEFVEGWRSGVYPLRLKHGFAVDSAWVVEGEDRFVAAQLRRRPGAVAGKR